MHSKLVLRQRYSILHVITDVTVTWYKQERDDTDNYIKQENLPEMTEMTLCFRFKPLELNHNDPQGQTYVMSITDPG